MAWRGYRELSTIVPEKVEADLLFDWIVEAKRQAPCVLLEKDGKIIGFWGLCTLKPRWSHDVILGDYMFYVYPEHRSMQAVKLLKMAVEAVADHYDLNLKLSYLFVADEPRKKAAHIRLFEKVGFAVIGVMGIYRGKNGR